MSTTVPDTAPIRQEIDRSRQEMGQALFQLANRLAPKKLIPQLKETAKLKATEKLQELKVRFNPVNIIKRKLDGEPKKVIPARGYEANGHRPRELTRS